MEKLNDIGHTQRNSLIRRIGADLLEHGRDDGGGGMTDKAWRPTAKTWEKINEMSNPRTEFTTMSMPRLNVENTMEKRIRGETCNEPTEARHSDDQRTHSYGPYYWQGLKPEVFMRKDLWGE